MDGYLLLLVLHPSPTARISVRNGSGLVLGPCGAALPHVQWSSARTGYEASSKLGWIYCTQEVTDCGMFRLNVILPAMSIPLADLVFGTPASTASPSNHLRHFSSSEPREVPTCADILPMFASGASSSTDTCVIGKYHVHSSADTPPLWKLP